MASLAVFAAAAFVFLAASMSSTSAAVYTVGDARGWAVPPRGSESYNHWGLKNRFRVGDVVEFKYVNDSVLVVNHDGYRNCSSLSPVVRFTDGDTKYLLDRPGLIYFISGVPERCERGLRMRLRVRSAGPGPAPAPGPTRAALPLRPPAIGAPRPAAVIAAVTPSSPSASRPSTSTSTSPSPSPSPSPGPAQASGASGLALTGFSMAAALLVVCVVSVFILV
uniref:Phytocyanin domain-containing protein n=1 Tax=Oryza punctata TaxID=4537 RepID=A0A0E0K4P3_ORYPU